jgi:phage terminase Nu1 subunit (DNA packaging protein)
MGKRQFVVTRTELADLLGVAPDSITRYTQMGMPTLTVGSGRGNKTTFDLRAALAWWIASADGDARERLLTLQADRIAFDLQVKQGAYVSVEEATRDFENVATATKARLRRIPSAIAERMMFAAREGPGAVQALLIKEIDDALRELAAKADETVQPCAG